MIRTALLIARALVEAVIEEIRATPECWRIIGDELHAYRVQREQDAVRSRNTDAQSVTTIEVK